MDLMNFKMENIDEDDGLEGDDRSERGWREWKI